MGNNNDLNTEPNKEQEDNSVRNIKIRYYSWMFIAVVIMVVAYCIGNITNNYLVLFIFLLVSFTCYILLFIKYFFKGNKKDKN